MRTIIIHRGPRENPFDTYTQASWFIALTGWKRVDEIRERLDASWWGRCMLPLALWWNRIFQWNARPQVIKISSHSTWSMDVTLAHIIKEMLIVLKTNPRGSGFVDPEDCPEKLRPTETSPLENGYVGPTHHDRYDWLLDELIWTFDALTKDVFDIEEFCEGEPDIQLKEIQINGEKMFEVNTGPNNTFKLHTDKIEAWKNRRANGLRLFAKYYETL